MKRSKPLKGLKVSSVVFMVFLLITGAMVFSATRSSSYDQSQRAKLLNQIQANILAYRLAETEFMLSSTPKMKEEYLSRIKSVRWKLDSNQKMIEDLLLTDQVQTAFEKFRTAWEKYLEESSGTLSVAGGDSDRRDIEQLRDESRELYEKAFRSLEALIETNKRAPDSWAEFVKIVYKENRLTFVLLFMWGVALFLVLITISYRKKALED